MNITVMREDPAAASRLLREYERELSRADDPELREVLVGLEAQAQGWPVVHLSQAISEGGQREHGLPNLAVARADKHVVMVHSQSPDGYYGSWRRRHVGGCLVFNSWGDGERRKGVDVGQGLLCVDALVPWTLDTAYFQRWYADVPVIPPGPRRKAGGKTRLKDHLVLWEVEEWRTNRHPVPPVDPMLLRPLGGEMYAVVAHWDLTPLERAVIASRRRTS